MIRLMRPGVAALLTLAACGVSLSLQPVADGAFKTLVVIVIVLMWIPLSGLGAWLLVRASGWLTLLVALSGFGLMLLPGDWLAMFYRETGMSTMRLSMDHLLFYFGVSATHCFLAGDQSRRFLLWTFAGFLLSGLAVEIVQLYVPGRQAEAVDLLADAAGLALGMIAGVAGRRLWSVSLR